MREARGRRVAHQAQPATAAPATDPRVEALERLAKLREAGVLTDEGVEAEKRRILS